MRFKRHWHSAKPKLSVDGLKYGGALGLMLLLAGCASSSHRYSARTDSYPSGARDLSQVQDAVPHYEPRARSGNQPLYTVLGKQYSVLRSAQGYVEEGGASFYGNKFHGYATSSGEPYDMYAMTAAHKRLPLPSYARVTNLDNGRSVVVRVNDRGPFHDGRIVDLSYAAAWRLGIAAKGTGHVRVEGIDPLALGASAPASEARPAPSENLNAPVAVSPTAPRVAASTVAAGRMNGGKMLQVAALSSEQHAQQLQAQLSTRLSLPVAVQKTRDIYRIHVGPFHDEVALMAAREALNDAGYAHPIEVDAMP